jgi:hypothetical protein
VIIEGIIGSFAPENNFWEIHRNLLIIPELKKFHNYDKSQSKNRSSKEMWGFCFLFDMGDVNFMRHMTEDARKELIAETVICDKNYDWEKEIKVINVVQSLCQPPPQRSLYETYKKLEERDTFIRDTNYSLDSFDAKGKLIKGTADQLDKMLINSGKLYEQIEFWQRKVMMERDTRKGKILSESESGEI